MDARISLLTQLHEDLDSLVEGGDSESDEKQLHREQVDPRGTAHDLMVQVKAAYRPRPVPLIIRAAWRALQAICRDESLGDSDAIKLVEPTVEKFQAVINQEIERIERRSREQEESGQRKKRGRRPDNRLRQAVITKWKRHGSACKSRAAFAREHFPENDPDYISRIVAKSLNPKSGKKSAN